jgi:glycerophosphoryl diester phosphodiesterase
VLRAQPIFSDPPVLCGHRGSGAGLVAGERENTLGSLLAAVAAGLPWVELDARLNADGVLVARHDPVADDGRFVADLSTEETDGLGLDRVTDLLEALPREVGVDVEIKSAAEDALRERALTTAGRVAELLRALPARPLLVSSFDPAALLIVRERLPALPLGLLTWTRFPLRKAIPAAVHLGVEAVAAQFESFPLPGTRAEQLERPLEDVIALAHRAGLQVIAWCPPPDAARRLGDAGVDCLVVDRHGRS